MQLLRRLSLAALWLLAGVGILCGVVWGVTAAGLAKPLVVISGSMEPEIMTGDLLIATKTPAAELAVGDVVSLPSALTSNLVTHRIIAIAPSGDGSYIVSMKGDNNEFEDALDYTVAGDVWQPAAQLSGWGTALMRLGTPVVALPLGLGLVGLLGLVLLTPAPVRQTERPRPAQGTRAAARMAAAS